MRATLPLVKLAPAGVVLGGAAPSTQRPASSTQLRGWRWLALGIGSVALWLHTLSLGTGMGAVAHWLPGLAIAAALRFLWLNRARKGLRLLAAGAACNLLVMLLNGGLMPISPHTAQALGLPVQQVNRAGIVQGGSKDRVIPDGEARLAYLDDRIVFQVGKRHTAASIGDGIVVLGCIVTLIEELLGGAGQYRPVTASGRQSGLATSRRHGR